MPRPVAWQGPIADCDAFVLHLDADSVDILADGQVVSAPDVVDSMSLIVALGGDPAPWYRYLVAARRAIDLAQEANKPPGRLDLIRAVRSLARPMHAREQMARSNYSPDPIALWRRVVLAVDPAPSVRMTVARGVVPGDVGKTILATLVADPDPQVVAVLTRRADALWNGVLLPRLVENAHPEIRAIMADRLPHDSAWMGMLLEDPDERVVIAARRTMAAGRYR